MFQATRRRLAIWYTAITAVLLLVFACGVYLYVRETLVERIDDTLNHVVEVVERSLAIERTSLDTYHINIEASFRDNADSVEDDHIDIEWFSPTGELLWSTFSQPLDIPIRGNHIGETVRIQRQPDNLDAWHDSENPDDFTLVLRQVTQRVEYGRQVLGYLRVSHPWFEVTKPSRQLIVDLGLGIVLMIVSVAASGWFLSGKAMEPVGESYQRLKQFTADASHELRSPIALIQTNVQVAIAELDSLDPIYQPNGYTITHYRHQLQVIERLTQRLGKLVNDLLFLARKDSGIENDDFTPCPLDALLMEVVEEQQLIAQERQISLSLKLAETENPSSEQADDWFSVQGNWEQLGRLFTNLIGNALRYTQPLGSVTVTLSRIENHQRRSALRSSAYLKIQISDTGIGIPPEAIPRIFDRFYRVDPARTHQGKNQNVKGTGLGLAIASAIVENHGGQIGVDSKLDQGTTFTVLLPVN
ncbi:sensor histidine kinase [Calothrix sp. NIES-3974]|uniref:sensor histidine kinase n=1 Tax=Calothrix sp. NIES-3974 TaxID=2005462 RepID=UPI000B607825|nr:HAMP domain-containing sensor histidine kinase [Calothrix sp. NIES-3974]BAZ07161.1 integral membrane sensor signal transduction histidine kinase [Calothrix sp. NIES-3974]